MDNLEEEDHEDLDAIILNQKRTLRKAEKADTAFGKLNELEQMIVMYYLQDDNLSIWEALISSGAAETPEHAAIIASRLFKNGRVAEAVEEMQKLQGITLGRIQQRLWKMFNNIGDDGEDSGIYGPREQLGAGKILAQIHMPKKVEETRPTEINEQRFKANRKGISGRINEIISEIEG